MPRVYLTIAAPDFVWEARDGEVVVGRAEVLDGETAWICRIHVHPRHRGLGYASLLLRAVLAYFPDVTVGLAANVLPTGQPGLSRDELTAWYARHGFVSAPVAGDPYRMLRVPPVGSGTT